MQIVQYKEAFGVYLTVYPTGNINVRNNYGYVKGSQGKCCVVDAPSSLEEELRYKVSYSPVDPNKKTLFVSSHSSIPRDILRNSGYSITRDRNKADYIIIPRLKDSSVFSTRTKAVVKSNDNLYLYSIYYRGGISNISEDTQEKVKQFIQNDKPNAKILQESLQYGGFINCAFISKCEEWESLLTTSYSTKTHIFDTDIPITGSVNISLETLSVWRTQRDEMLEKIMLNSNWQQYPLTMCVFIYAEKYSMIHGSRSQAFKLMLDAIHYDTFRHSKDLSGTVISQDDWNMAQRWALLRMGMPEQGGYVRPGQENCDPVYSDILQKRTVYRPVFITEPMSHSALQSLSKQ